MTKNQGPFLLLAAGSLLALLVLVAEAATAPNAKRGAVFVPFGKREELTGPAEMDVYTVLFY